MLARPAAMGRNSILSRPSLGPSAFGLPDPAAIGVRPELFAGRVRLDPEGRQFTERRCLPAFWMTPLFHEYVGRGVRLRMQFALAVASSLEDAPLRVDP